MFRVLKVIWVVVLTVGVGTIVVSPSVAGNTASKQAAIQAPINLNSATSADLVKLPGVGEKTAQAIVDYRDQNGPFRSVDDLVQVKGIGDKKLEAVRAMVAVE